jgi:hypothetical protein
MRENLSACADVSLVLPASRTVVGGVIAAAMVESAGTSELDWVVGPEAVPHAVINKDAADRKLTPAAAKRRVRDELARNGRALESQAKVEDGYVRSLIVIGTVTS